MSSTDPRRVSLHTTHSCGVPMVTPIPAPPAPVVAVNLGEGADLYLDPVTAAEFAQKIAAAAAGLTGGDLVGAAQRVALDAAGREVFEANARAALDAAEREAFAAAPGPGPCPSWCGLPAGHVWRTLEPDTGAVGRGHVRSFGAAEVTVYERWVPGVGLRLDEPRVSFYAPGEAGRGEEMAAGQAAAAAAELAGAARFLEALDSAGDEWWGVQAPTGDAVAL